jgi:hypothetical protein
MEKVDLPDAIRAIREIIRRAILTFKAEPDRDASFLRQGNTWHVVHSVNEAYGYSPAAIRDFTPTRHELDQAEIVETWLTWLYRVEGKASRDRIIAWALGTSLWLLAQDEKVSERTIVRRIDRSIVKIINKLVGTKFDLQIVDEPYKATPFAMVWEKPAYADKVTIQTVYVYGKGLMRNGRPWNDGGRKAERFVK